MNLTGGRTMPTSGCHPKQISLALLSGTPAQSTLPRQRRIYGREETSGT